MIVWTCSESLKIELVLLLYSTLWPNDKYACAIVHDWYTNGDFFNLLYGAPDSTLFIKGIASWDK